MIGHCLLVSLVILAAIAGTAVAYAVYLVEAYLFSGSDEDPVLTGLSLVAACGLIAAFVAVSRAQDWWTRRRAAASPAEVVP